MSFPNFRSCFNHGFQLNIGGLIVSVQFGENNYCERGHLGDPTSDMGNHITDSEDAEVMVFRMDEHNQRRVVVGWPHGPVDAEYGGERGFLSPNQVADVIQWANGRSKEA